jgi:hypothetical protein
LEKTPPGKLELSVTGKGTELLFPALRLGVDTLEIDVKPYLSYGYLYTPKLTDMLMRILPGSVEIHGFSPDTVSLAFSQKIRRQLKVAPRVNFIAPEGYMLTQKPVFEPNEVSIYGAREDVAKFETWPTENMTIAIPPNENRFTVAMVKSEDIIVEPATITAVVVYERFTEGEVERPVKVSGELPPGVRARFIPEKVKVKFLAPFSRFDNVSVEDFSVEVEADELDPHALYVHPRLTRSPAGIRPYLEPAYVRFVIQSELP